MSTRSKQAAETFAARWDREGHRISELRGSREIASAFFGPSCAGETAFFLGITGTPAIVTRHGVAKVPAVIAARELARAWRLGRVSPGPALGEFLDGLADEIGRGK